MEQSEIKAFLDEKVLAYNNPSFIESDPISIPHQFSRKEDIEIAGFLAATIAWGKRALILEKANLWMELMEHSPYEFLMSANASDWLRFEKFYYRTFSSVDCVYFLKALKHLYVDEGGLEKVFTSAYESHGIIGALTHFRTRFLSYSVPDRTTKHVANIQKKSAGKRLNMFLRWMVRDDHQVDFGLWKGIDKADLYLPLDVHTGNVSRKLNLLTRKQSDWLAVDEVTAALRQFDRSDPVKYDFALFGLGINEGF